MNSSEELYLINQKQCKKCKTIQIESRIICIKCRNNTFISIQGKAKGKIITYTELHALPNSIQGKKSIFLVLVQLDNGSKILGQYENTMKNDGIIGRMVKGFEGKLSIDEQGKEIRGVIFRDD
jgi:uncharacterized OB-fold protein